MFKPVQNAPNDHPDTAYRHSRFEGYVLAIATVFVGLPVQKMVVMSEITWYDSWTAVNRSKIGDGCVLGAKALAVLIYLGLIRTCVPSKPSRIEYLRRRTMDCALAEA
jgi:hypothetical protein